MYESILSLQSRPFASSRTSEQVCFGQSIQKALANTRICIERGLGPALIIGAPGVGKTTLLSVLGQQYEHLFHVVTISCSRMDGRQEFLQSVLFELRRNYRGMSEGELRLSLLDFLRSDTQKPGGLLLMIDDGENLSAEVMDEIRVVSNFVRDGQPRTCLIIAGGFRLEEILNDVRLQSLNQRIATRCFLRNLTQAETADYVREQVRLAGGDCQRLFGEDSLQTIFDLTDGCPRWINQLCDHALILCATHGRAGTDSALIREAWGDLQCFPEVLCDHLHRPAFGTCGTDSDTKSDWSIIEFGSLDESCCTENSEPQSNAPAAPSWSFQSDESDQAWRAPAHDHHEHEQELPSTVGFESEPENHWSIPPIVVESPSPTLDLRPSWEAQTDIDDRQSPSIGSPACSNWDSPGHDNGIPSRLAESIQPNLPYVAANPFAESFNETEVVQSRYASQIARCNRSSQDLTPNDLTCLQSLADRLDASLPSTTFPLTGSDSEQPDGDVQPSCEPMPCFVQTESSLESQAQRQAAGQSENAWQTPTGFEQHRQSRAWQQDPPAAPRHVAEEADAILQQLANAFGEAPETYDRPIRVPYGNPAGSPTFTARLATDPAAALNNQENGHESHSWSGHSEIQQLESLQRAIEDQNKFSAQAFDRLIIQTNSQSQTEGWSIRPAQTSPVTSTAHGSQEHLKFNAAAPNLMHQDDRDMLICQPSEDQAGVEAKHNQNRLPFPPTPVSTGRAERMDYQQLFDQLRNLPNT